MERTEIIIGDWKVSRVDPLNWRVYHRGEGKQDWIANTAYFSDMINALMWVRRQNFADKGLKLQINDVVDEIKKLDKVIIKEFKKAIADE